MRDGELFFVLVFIFTKKGNEGNFWGDGNILYLDLGGRHTLYTYVKIRIIYLCPISHFGQFPLPILGKIGDFFLWKL